MSQMQVNLPIASERDDELGPSREMTKDDFAAINAAIKSQALAWLQETGEVPPTVFLPSIGSEGLARMGVMPAGDLVNHPVGKDILVMLMARLIEDPNHDFVIFAHEAWVLQSKTDDPEQVQNLRDAAKSSIADHPERTEAVVINARSKNRHAMCIFPISRDENGVASVADGEMVFSDVDGASFEGRFAPPPVRPAGTTLH